MKRKVYTDGNGSTLIAVDGLGQYVPASEFISLQTERNALSEQLKRIIEVIQHAKDEQVPLDAVLPELIHRAGIK
jgi:hypothetical protein